MTFAARRHSQFRLVQLPGGFASDFDILPGGAVAAFVFDPSGTVSRTQGASSIGEPNWHVPTTGGVGAGYWIQATLVSGTAPAGSGLGSWLDLGAVRSWSLTINAVGSLTCTLSISIASDAGGANVLATGIYNITVEAEP